MTHLNGYAMLLVRDGPADFAMTRWMSEFGVGPYQNDKYAIVAFCSCQKSLGQETFDQW